VHAIDIATGEPAWIAPPGAPLCGAGGGCSTAMTAALTSIPGVVFGGSADGGIRAWGTSTGDLLWTFDTNGMVDTVNGIQGSGGSMDGPGPVVAGGMLYVTAGNGGIVGTPGNLLLAFEVKEERNRSAPVRDPAVDWPGRNSALVCIYRYRHDQRRSSVRVWLDLDAAHGPTPY
jgi:outer membrane protein assembly factor BamB